MSNITVPGENPGGKSRHLNGGASLLLRAPLEPDDEQGGEWSREELLRMDADFCVAVERTIARGLESPAAARATQSFQKFLKRVDVNSV